MYPSSSQDPITGSPPLTALSPHKKLATVQSQLSNADCSSDYEGNTSKSIVVNPMYPPSTSSNQTTPTSVNTSNNLCTPSNLDDYASKDPMFLPGGALGLDLKGGQTSGSEILDSCDFECEFECELDEQSLLDVDMDEDFNPHDVSDVEMDDQS